MKRQTRHFDLQAKISFVLVAVILPTFFLSTVAENKITGPILKEEVRQIGIHSAKTLAAEISSLHLLSRQNPTTDIEDSVQTILYTQPDITRIDVIARDQNTGTTKIIATTVEEESSPVFPLVEAVTTQFKTDENGSGSWEIFVPIETKGKEARIPKKLVGVVHVVASTKLVDTIMDTLWKAKAAGAVVSVIILIFLLSYFLRKTISNDRLLRKVEFKNVQLSEQLHEAQRQLMLKEKFSVMGQLTANFAHELGTPLNALGGHLQILKEEVPHAENRLSIIEGQLQKIEGIVRGFLHSTAKPVSKKQLVDLNQLIDKTLGIVQPRIDSLGVEVARDFDRNMGPMPLVPLDLEQILLNLLNNSLDSLDSVSKQKSKLKLELKTARIQDQGVEWAQMSVLDTGSGIGKADLKNVFKPFFTTKRPGEGTGLGLPICRQVIQKYGGWMILDSKEGAWTRVVFRLPYHNEGLTRDWVGGSA